MLTFPLLLTIYAGFTHAFEADHLLAVSNIVSRRNTTSMSLKDGVFWGLGHASTIFFIGVVMIIFKVGIPQQYFHYLEATVGCMLIVLGIYRIVKFYRNKKIIIPSHAYLHKKEDHTHLHFRLEQTQQHPHSLAYSVGLVHGLAGSGALVVVVLSQMKGPVDGLTYLLLFGIACIAGMMLAAGLFSVPFSKKVMQGHSLQNILIILSSILCCLYGTKVIYENLIA